MRSAVRYRPNRGPDDGSSAHTAGVHKEKENDECTNLWADPFPEFFDRAKNSDEVIQAANEMIAEAEAWVDYWSDPNTD